MNEQWEKQFDTTKNKWYARVNLGGQPKYGITIAAALIGQPSQVLWDYYYRVSPHVGWWNIFGWPNDSVICDQIGVTRV